MGSIRRSGKAAFDLFVFSIPITVSLFAELLTAVTDTFLAGHLGGQSASALAAMSLAAPVMGIFVATQSLFALPIGVVVARCIDDRKRRDARFFFATTVCTGVSGLLSVAFVASIGWLLPALGAHGEELAMLEGYLIVQAVSNVASAVGFSLATGIRALGHPIVETVITTASVVADIALNVVFAFGLDFGFMGLAYGTLASEVICAAACAAWLARVRLLPAPRMLHGKEASECLREIVEIGVAQGAPQFVAGVAMVFSNAAMASMGTDQVAAWGIAQRCYMLAITPMVGMSNASQTLLALREGEGDVKGARSVARVAVCLSAMLGAATGLLSVCGAGAVTTAFGAIGSLGEMAKEGLVISCVALPFVGVSQTVGAVLIVRGFPRYVIAACLCRNAAFAILALCFSAFPEAAYGFVAMSAPISDCIAAFLIIVLGRRIAGFVACGVPRGSVAAKCGHSPKFAIRHPSFTAFEQELFLN
ncbi:MATE family efflux transporter [uncultured Slackia sp.]|uniref:MATE family efflux transporter n=1 Tax=uncultured Slackia sp. TaxID=665903 RepID=UPI0026DEFD8B|nr:MATE family efflux transporter [uncultured Slackia sp.]